MGKYFSWIGGVFKKFGKGGSSGGGILEREIEKAKRVYETRGPLSDEEMEKIRDPYYNCHEDLPITEFMKGAAGVPRASSSWQLSHFFIERREGRTH